MLSYLDLISGGPQSLGIKLDVFAASCIYIILGTLATVILFNKKYSLKDKFNTIALPISIFFLGLVISISLRLNSTTQLTS